MLNLLDAPAATVKERAVDNTVLVSPHHVSLAAGAGAADIISVAGYPTGRHHTLIKASEARLAIQSGASEVWVSLDASVADANAVLSELIAIREACPDPARLGLIVPDAPLADATLKAAHQAGYQRLIVRSRKAADYAESAAGEEGKKKGPELAAATLPVLEFPAPAV
ncbi:MAG: deoxyribose-phosphate aldolase [Corynebacterium sp.]|uniref:deoxyribose-phosphate aldolase n=2 Tax=Corynebacterium sp. TaxID=1720 RepID=UPI00280B0BBE|nr:deoxyribose-phosphate aldolase [Corynebacterium sp.]MDU3165558.1 deoxyribose-phosphate aldolase [Corynebacterium sp.]MDU5328299.1 deoxyribose-phosphate aldolase [Corynebacterium sp.]MDU6417261.1 deoxyribose-phosphate aldolase [Corynebacterium sp.]MDU6592107.1 deoxyribose-phosphate aldolase [Corynebacterium sp.]MDU7737177.1 deoxyribose-phosphate aldolase [Corynebacterium sp.]